MKQTSSDAEIISYLQQMISRINTEPAAQIAFPTARSSGEDEKTKKPRQSRSSDEDDEDDSLPAEILDLLDAIERETEPAAASQPGSGESASQICGREEIERKRVAAMVRRKRTEALRRRQQRKTADPK